MDHPKNLLHDEAQNRGSFLPLKSCRDLAASYRIMEKLRVLFLDTTHPILPTSLEEMGFVCEHFLHESYEEVMSQISLYDGIVIRSRLPLDTALLSRASKLRFIARVGAGMENVDHAFAEARGITCLNAPEGNRDAVGEHALGMLLVLMNHMIRSDKEVRNGLWRREFNRGEEIMGKTVAIIGYGNTGSAFARRLSGFGVQVIAYDKYKKGFSDPFVKECTMDEIFQEADILSLHIPLTPETDYLVNTSYLAKFRKPIYLINTSRGRNVCTSDLVEGLQTGKVKGAALDVLEYEKSTLEELIPGSIPPALAWLIASDQVILTPHIAGWTIESLTRLAQVLVAKIKSLYPDMPDIQ